MTRPVTRRAHRADGATGTRVRLLVAAALALCCSAAGTYAYWSDSVGVGGTRITTGTVDLKVDNQDTLTAYASMSLAGMVPGNTTAAVFTVRNAGTAPLTYYLDAAATNADGKGLGAALVVKVTGAATVTGTGTARTCGGAALAGSGTAFGSNLLGSAAAQRPLASTTSETVCVQAGVAPTAPSALQGAVTDVTFTFRGSQVIP